jgi:streptogramin lyase
MNLILAILIMMLFTCLFNTIITSLATAQTTAGLSKDSKLSDDLGNVVNNNTNDNLCSALKSSTPTQMGTLDIFMDPGPQQVGINHQTNFKVIFLLKGQTNTPQEHIDYDFTITKDGGKQVLQASALAGHRGVPLHTAEGTVNIPYKFQEMGRYLVNITVYGILFNPISPVSVLFPIKIAPQNDVSNNVINTVIQQKPSGSELPLVKQQQYSYLKELGSSGQYKFQNLTGLALDPSNNVYVIDTQANMVAKLSSDGKFITAWNSSADEKGPFHYPTAIAYNLDNAYVSNFNNLGVFNNNTIQKFSSDGKFITAWGSFGSCKGQLEYPTGVAVDSKGQVYISDNGNARVQKFSSDGKFITAWGINGTGSGQFNGMYGLALDPLGNVYVVDSGNNRIQKFSSDGKFITAWGSFGIADGQFSHPRGIALDSLSNVYVVDSGNNRIQKFSSDGKFITAWGSTNDGATKFKFADSIAVDALGRNVYITDLDTPKIRVFSAVPSGITG